MGLKILHSADWHLDSPFRSLPQGAGERLREMQRALPGRIAALCQQEHCDMVLLSGDLFDAPAPSRAWVDAVRRALEQCAVPVCIAPGNHDYCTDASPWLTEAWPENVHIFTGGLEYIDLPSCDCRVYGAGYRSMDCPGLLDGFRAEGDARWCVGVLHGDPLSLSSPCCPVTAAQVRESGLDYLALGHIHAAGSFRAGQTLCAWPGCPMGRGWDETGEKGVYLVTLEERAAVRWLPLGLPQFYDLQAEVRTDALSALEAVLPPAESPDLFRVTLTGYGAVDVQRLKSHFSHLALLELRDETRKKPEPWADAGEDSLRGVYFALLKRMAEESPEQRELAALAAEISAALLDGEEVRLP